MMARACFALGVAATTLTACGGSSSDSTAATTAAPAADTLTSTTPEVASATSVPSDAAVSVPAPAPATTVPAGDTTSTETSVTDVPASSGVRFESPDGRFAVDFADTPTEQEFSAEATDGSPITVSAYLGSIDGGAGVASCVDVGDVGGVGDLDVDAVLDEAITQALANFGAELDSSVAIELQGRDGREFAATGAGGLVVGRAFLDGDGVCEVIGIMTGDVDGADFVESFEFLEAAA